MKCKICICLFVLFTVSICISADYNVVLKSTGKVIIGKYLRETDNTLYVDVGGVQIQFKKELLDLEKMKELNTLPPADLKKNSKGNNLETGTVTIYSNTSLENRKKNRPPLGDIAAIYEKKRQPPLKASTVENSSEKEKVHKWSSKGQLGAFLWKLDHEAGPVYLLGSIHAVNKSVYPLPAAMEKAFVESDTVAVEVDILKNVMTFDSKEVYESYLETIYYPFGETLQKHISHETYKLLIKEFERFPIDNFVLERVRPWAIADFLLGAELEKAHIDSELGIDRYFLNRAKARQKRIVELESMQFQAKLFSGFSDKEQEMYLLSALNDISTEFEMMNVLMAAWRAGDVQTIEKMINDAYPVNSELVAYRKKILTERNRGMLRKIEGLIAEKGTDLVIVGAAHLVGYDGLITLLRNKGYKLIQQ